MRIPQKESVHFLVFSAEGMVGIRYVMAIVPCIAYLLDICSTSLMKKSDFIKTGMLH